MVVFVDSSPQACGVLRENLKSLGIQGNKASIWERPVSSLVETLKDRGERFDLIYADPPYDLPLGTLEVASWCQLLVPGGALAIEFRYPRLLPLHWCSETQPAEVRRYGETGVLFLEAPRKPA
jgi:16S rRNA G966 N2-methylase RsmD